jgi:hypothetical protein
MVEWLAIAALFYLLAMYAVSQPQMQTALWKCGHITIGAFAGYWIDRNLYGRIDDAAQSGRMVARAVVVAAAIVGMAFGL